MTTSMTRDAVERLDEAFHRAARAIFTADEVVLACHVHPDGDALGSMLAMAHALRGRGYPVIASFPEPFEIAPHYREIPGRDLLTPPDRVPAEPDVMITFDCSSLSRLGELQRPAKGARELIVVDHHVSNDAYGTINVIDPRAAATGVLVRRLIAELELALDEPTAVCLYAALVCDTGRFQYESTTPEVFELARELLAFDVPVTRLSRSLFEEHRFAYLRLVGEALSSAELVRDKRFVWTAVTQEMLRRHGVTLDEAEGLIDLVRGVSEAEVSCVLKEEADGRVRVSLRSLGEVDVSVVAARHGGGGHRFAAGFTSSRPIAEIVERIQSEI
ncbi:MAG: bifunctional oligoribonuclease/PAP phosphatase NrnA [Acidimicrobiia bacterium]